VVDGLPGREVVGQQPPSAAASKDVEDGVKYLAGVVQLGTSGGFGYGQVRFEASPFGVGKVGLVCFSHARYPTERMPQTPLSEKAPRVNASAVCKFTSDVPLADHVRLHTVLAGRRTLMVRASEALY
jgi:hypothetical protein